MFVYQAKTIIYGLLAAKILGITNVFVLFGGLGSVFRDKKESLSAKILKMQYRLTVRFANKVFVQNDDDLNELLNEKIVKADNVQIINGSGVNLTKYKKMDLPEGMTFLFVGRLIKDKGIMEYLYAAEKVKLNYPDARFWIVGYFDTNPSAITSDELGKYIERGIVEYLGYKADVYPYLKSCSVFVLPSYHEGTPKSTLEAMATGRPVLTTDVPGCRETVINTENGFLVPSNNVEELAKMMEWFINNQDKLTLMGERSRRICEEKYDVNKVNEVIMNTMNL
jgi:glycosyltransferase involved in cell wall biosynthesis